MNQLLRCCGMAAVLAAVLAARPVSAQEVTLPKEVQTSVQRGVSHLKKLQANGIWPHEQKGATPLAAWTLLECGVSPNDPVVQQAATFARELLFNSDRTYDLSLAILFLDKLGDPEDEPIIELLALRLMSGQNRSHGWTYTVAAAPAKDVARVREHMAKLKAAGPRQLPEKPPADKEPRDATKVHADVLAAAEALNKLPIPAMDYTEVSDNSNTQFALLALWVARRHGMPVDQALARVESRFRLSQNRLGGWGYYVMQPDPKAPNQPPGSPFSPTGTMTSVGLIALAVGSATNSGKKGKVDLNNDAAIRAALPIVSANLGEPGLPKESLQLRPKSKGYYFLWTLERMAVIYNFKTINGKDWHHWGTDLILANQQADGSWQGEYANGGCDTCFALLFLVKANVAHDLTVKFKDKVKDPGKVSPELLDLIGRQVPPSVDKATMPKKNAPAQERIITRPEEGISLLETPVPSWLELSPGLPYDRRHRLAPN